MVDLVIELMLIGMIFLPLIATSPRLARAANRGYCGRLGNARRSH